MYPTKFVTAASALKGVPSWNVTPSRSVTVNSVASSFTSYPVASEGCMLPSSPS